MACTWGEEEWFNNFALDAGHHSMIFEDWY